MNKKNEGNPILTILVCCYNGGRYLKGCLDSIGKQTADKRDFKTLIVDDGSTDNSTQIIRNFASSYNNTAVLSHGKNLGLSAACNTGLAYIKTPYFVRVDADDTITPDFVEILLDAIRHKEADCYITDRYEVIKGKRLLVEDMAETVYRWTSSGVTMKTDVVKKIGGYTNEYWEEYDLYIRLLEDGHSYSYIKKPIYIYRKHSDSITANVKKRIAGLESLENKWGSNLLSKYGDYRKSLIGTELYE